MDFSHFNLEAPILEALQKMGYEKATPIQVQAIPLVLSGHDVIALAETGSGKTAACAIPISNRVDPTLKAIQALIVVPTRELALQYAMETQKIGSKKGVKAFALYGGEDYERQEAKLRAGVHVLVATPGRLIDYIYSRRIDLNEVSTLILDEADEMLGMGFYDDLEFIIQCLVHEHQTLLFSATMPKEIKKIAGHHMKSPKEVTLINDKPTPKLIEHLFYFCKNPKDRLHDLSILIKTLKAKQILIFCNSRREVEEGAHHLKRLSGHVDFLHGGLSQDLRSKITDKFRRHKTDILVATDVAARGLDFSGVTHVINVHFPRDDETYVHRSGRTGRSGRAGTCITLVTRRDLSRVKTIAKKVGKPEKWLSEEPKA